MIKNDGETEEVGQRSRQILAHGEDPKTVRLTRGHIREPKCAPGKHCTSHGYERQPVFQCCHCGAQFVLD